MGAHDNNSLDEPEVFGFDFGDFADDEEEASGQPGLTAELLSQLIEANDDDSEVIASRTHRPRPRQRRIEGLTFHSTPDNFLFLGTLLSLPSGETLDALACQLPSSVKAIAALKDLISSIPADQLGPAVSPDIIDAVTCINIKEVADHYYFALMTAEKTSYVIISNRLFSVNGKTITPVMHKERSPALDLITPFSPKTFDPTAPVFGVRVLADIVSKSLLFVSTIKDMEPNCFGAAMAYEDLFENGQFRGPSDWATQPKDENDVRWLMPYVEALARLTWESELEFGLPDMSIVYADLWFQGEHVFVDNQRCPRGSMPIGQWDFNERFERATGTVNYSSTVAAQISKMFDLDGLTTAEVADFSRFAVSHYVGIVSEYGVYVWINKLSQAKLLTLLARYRGLTVDQTALPVTYVHPVGGHPVGPSEMRREGPRRQYITEAEYLEKARSRKSVERASRSTVPDNVTAVLQALEFDPKD